MQNTENMNSNSQLFKMSIPIFIELLLQLLVGNMDQIMISRLRPRSMAITAAAAIVNANQVMNIVIIVINITSMATTVLLSQYLGAKNKKKISETCTVSFLVISIMSVVATIIVLGFNRQIFMAMNIEGEVLNQACSYLFIVGAFILVQGLYLNFAAILRSFTLMKEVMFVSIIMNILNIVGNAILINGLLGFPKLGIIGAAISTIISKTIGLILIMWLFHKKINAKIEINQLKPFPSNTLSKILKIGLPLGVEGLSYNMSQLCIIGIINQFGKTVTATKGYASILANISYVYSMAIGQVTQIIVGYLIGQGRKEQINKRVWDTCKIALAISLSITLIIYLNSDAIFGIFTDDPVILELGHRIMFVEFFLEIGRSINIVMTRILVTVGDIKTPIIVGISGEWIIAFAFSFLFGVVFKWGLIGVWVAMAVDECLRGFIYVIRFKSGKWKNTVGMS